MSTLNTSQQRSISTSFLDIHHRMAEMEGWMDQSQVTSAFSEYINDLSPTEAKVLKDYFARLRSNMLACLDEQGIPLEVRRTSLRWALQCGILFLQVALDEITPNRLAGYGGLDAAGRGDAEKIRTEINRVLDRIGAYVRQGLGAKLQERLSRLQATSVSAATLTLVDRVITRWQLVEFRPELEMIVRRLESPQFEIAVFGRVSCGKSSLLNHIAEMDVLPVGVTPITAVPTRLARGDQALARISFAELSPRTIPLEQLREYAAEEGNPGNQKHVTHILVQLPSARLREGVVFVDTPGIGSLALAGGAETFAYLPRCDLGVVLIDAGSTLNQEDLNLLRTLYEAGIPAQVLLSKADLLAPDDRQRMMDYIRNHLKKETGLDLPIHPVSTVGPDERLLSAWFEHDIEPLLEEHRALTEASLQRKIAVLKESVTAVLETLLAKQQRSQADGQPLVAIPQAKSLLEKSDETIRQADKRVRDWTGDEAALLEIIVHDVALEVVVSSPNAVKDTNPVVIMVLHKVLGERSQIAYRLVTDLQQNLGRTLEALVRVVPLVKTNPAAILALQFRGLPSLDLRNVQDRIGGFRGPWWAALVPRLAVRKVRKDLRNELGLGLREQVSLYDRQLRAWLRTCISQLAELFENQVEPFREQIRRINGSPDGEVPPADLRELQADFNQLRQTDSPESLALASSTTGK